MTATKRITPKSMRALATRLIDYFTKHEYWYDMGIYVDEERWSSYPMDNAEMHCTKNGSTYYVEKDVDIAAQMEYSNPKTISMYFEGPLYHKINYDDFDFLTVLGDKFLKPYGLYFELGYPWSAAAYEA